MEAQSFEETLLGFDAREMVPDEGRPSEFLLRTDLVDVLSVDRSVWPSLFDHSHRPAWIGMNDPFWDNLEALEAALPETAPPYWLVAATWHTDIGFDAELRQPGKILGPHLAPTVPARRDPAWQFLGFDIADPGISGLSNCGYGAGRDALASQWAPHLNRYHLFDDLARALAFRALTNARVPEHAPFSVLGLWRLEMRTPSVVVSSHSLC